MTRKQADKLLKLFGPNGEHWTKASYARNKYHDRVGSCDAEAVYWCLEGGTKKLGFRVSIVLAMEDRLRRSLKKDNVGITWWNDAPERTFAQVRRFIEQCVDSGAVGLDVGVGGRAPVEKET
jgi:hypothetical protein